MRPDQHEAIRKEFDEAVVDGNYALALRISLANLDLGLGLCIHVEKNDAVV